MTAIADDQTVSTSGNPSYTYGYDAAGDNWDRVRLGKAGTVLVGSSLGKVTVTPTLDTSQYASGDCLHTTILTFAGCAAANGGTGTVTKLTVVDADLQSAAGELWLFDTAVTPAAANAAHSISDADAAHCLGVIPFGPYYASALNSVSVNGTIRLTFKAATADSALYGIAVTRGTPTYTASGLTVSILVAQD